MRSVLHVGALFFVVLLCIACALSFYAGRTLFQSKSEPGPFVITDTAYVAKPTPAFSAPAPPPDSRTLFEQIPVPVDTCMGIPSRLSGVRISLVGPRPITFDRDRVILTRFDTDGERYVQDAYRQRRPTYTIAPYISYNRTGLWQHASAGAFFRWQRFSFTAGPAVVDLPGRRAVPGLSFGIRYLPTQYDFGYE